MAWWLQLLFTNCWYFNLEQNIRSQNKYFPLRWSAVSNLFSRTINYFFFTLLVSADWWHHSSKLMMEEFLLRFHTEKKTQRVKYSVHRLVHTQTSSQSVLSATMWSTPTLLLPVSPVSPVSAVSPDRRSVCDELVVVIVFAGCNREALYDNQSVTGWVKSGGSVSMVTESHLNLLYKPELTGLTGASSCLSSCLSTM